MQTPRHGSILGISGTASSFPAASGSAPITTPGNTFTVVWFERQSEEVVPGSFKEVIGFTAHSFDHEVVTVHVCLHVLFMMHEDARSPQAAGEAKLVHDLTRELLEVHACVPQSVD